VVLSPTREFTDHVTQELRYLFRLSGDSTIRRYLDKLVHGAHIVAGTPGPILGHLACGTLALDELNTPAPDEADRMFDLDFADVIAQMAER